VLNEMLWVEMKNEKCQMIYGKSDLLLTFLLLTSDL
jgi:hypothetical protein